ncbi:MAG: ComF family protein [Clostridia bacterium]|nr:ComF family protein [Clostridia bacterium]
MGRIACFGKRFFRWIRTHSETRGYTCDRCGKEIFTYPNSRLCEECEKLLPKNRAKTCPKCGRKTVSDGVCLECKSHAPAFEIGYSPFVYHQETASLINRMKNGQPWLARYFGECMADGFFKKNAFDFESETPLVAFVPMSETRKRERGYNQAQRLAEAFCERLKAKGIETELCENMLYKRVETLSQKDLDKNTRRKNAQESYRVQEKKLCKDRTVLLIDDIMTTSATGNACAEKLLKAGAKRVLFITACSLAEKVHANPCIDNFLLK